MRWRRPWPMWVTRFPGSPTKAAKRTQKPGTGPRPAPPAGPGRPGSWSPPWWRWPPCPSPTCWAESPETRASGQELGCLRGLDATKGPPGPGAGQHRDLQLAGVDLTVGAGQRPHGRLEGVGQRDALPVVALDPLGDGVRLAADDGEVALVDDGAVIGDVEELVVPGGGAHLGHQDLHLERLDVVGEHLADYLGI